jgi:glycosyltransferase involved in cell wall biosynthesis
VNITSASWKATRGRRSSPGPPKVIFLANGALGSAAETRASRIARELKCASSAVLHRSGSRVRDLARQVQTVSRARPNVTYAMDLALVPVLAGAAAKRSGRFIVDTGDAPADFFDLVGAPLHIRKAARLLERVGYGSADLIIVRGRHHEQALRKAGHENVLTIPDGVDLDVFRPSEDPELRQRLGLSEAFTVGIQGHFTWYPSLGGGLGWDLVHAIAARRDLPIHAVLIGDGPGLEELRTLARSLGVADRLHVIGRVPYVELARYLSLCDVCLLTQTNDASSWVRTTGKLPCYLATGRYILASRVGTASDLLPEEMLLEYIGHWDASYPERLAERLAHVLEDPARREKGLALRPLAAPFDYTVVSRQAAAAVEGVLGGPG